MARRLPERVERVDDTTASDNQSVQVAGDESDAPTPTPKSRNLWPWLWTAIALAVAAALALGAWAFYEGEPPAVPVENGGPISFETSATREASETAAAREASATYDPDASIPATPSEYMAQ